MTTQEKRAAYRRKWSAENKEQIREYQNKYRAEKGRKDGYSTEYYQKNKKRIIENQNRYKAKNKDKINAWKRQWRKADPNRIRLENHARRTKTNGIKIDLTKLHNWESRICGICEKLVEDVYELDHIIPLSRGGLHKESNLQLAHKSCNRRKHNKLPSEFTLVYA